MTRAACLAFAALIAMPAIADGDRARLPANATYRDECGSCHVPYPPGLLPAASWQHLMGGLSKHYGSDASLDATVAASLSQWLQANASRRRMEAPADDRITRSAWFVREHDEVPAGAWQRASIRSAANCSACHRGAADGDYDEHAVRIPR
jgi:hypothetical protein